MSQKQLEYLFRKRVRKSLFFLNSIGQLGSYSWLEVLLVKFCYQSVRSLLEVRRVRVSYKFENYVGEAIKEFN